MEANKQQLNLENWGLVVSNLEEVFLKVASDEYNVKGESKVGVGGSIGVGAEKVLNDPLENVSTLPPPRFFQTVSALIYKRRLTAKRDWGITLCQLLCPVFWILVWLAIVISELQPQDPLLLTAERQYNLDHEESERLRTPISFT